ncbi:MAG: preprotein translocase subunit SecG [Desulfamplus sp.]|nr:preprotein translocase subunit SecG [Desulfamplus sp.]
MATIILFIHIVSCILLILIVLLQTGKGSDMGASFGSASGQSLFGGAGPATALSKITTVVAVVFMLTSLTMAYTSGHKSSQTIMPETKAAVEAKKDVQSTDANKTSTDENKTTTTNATKEEPIKEKK